MACFAQVDLNSVLTHRRGHVGSSNNGSADKEDINWSMVDESDSNDESILLFDDTDVTWRAGSAQEILLYDFQGGTLTLMLRCFQQKKHGKASTRI
jgi:hypothetical protein